MDAIRSKQSQHNEGVRRLTFSKMLEVSFWGAVTWGLLRMVAHYLHFTPYGVAAFGRPFHGMYGENSAAGTVVGTVVLFVVTVVATFLYAIFFTIKRTWWGGILYGFAFLLIVGFFFHIGSWDQATLSTEIAWFLSFGMFIGMTLVLERFDEV